MSLGWWKDSGLHPESFPLIGKLTTVVRNNTFLNRNLNVSSSSNVYTCQHHHLILRISFVAIFTILLKSKSKCLLQNRLSRPHTSAGKHGLAIPWKILATARPVQERSSWSPTNCLTSPCTWISWACGLCGNRIIWGTINNNNQFALQAWITQWIWSLLSVKNQVKSGYLPLVTW